MATNSGIGSSPSKFLQHTLENIRKQVRRGRISCSSSPPVTSEVPQELAKTSEVAYEFIGDGERPLGTRKGLAGAKKASRAGSHAPAKKSEEPQSFVGEQERLAGAGRASGLWERENPRKRMHERVVSCAQARQPSVEHQLGLSE